MTVLFCCCAPRQPSLAKAAALRLPVFAFKYYRKIVQGWQKQPSFFASFFVFKNPATFYAVQLNQGGSGQRNFNENYVGSGSALSLSWINCWIEPNQSTNQNQYCLVGRPAPEVEADPLAEWPPPALGAGSKWGLSQVSGHGGLATGNVKKMNTFLAISFRNLWFRIKE